ncbi:MAG: YybS family protein [Spirochaetes bacterium]|nr:YybS family protein [Spirochaetota bacterium]
MKIPSSKNRTVHATGLILLTFTLHLIFLLAFTNLLTSSSVKFFLIILYYFYLAPLFLAVAKYKFKEYAIPSFIILLILIIFLKMMTISILIHLLIPALIFKLIFKDHKLKTYNKTVYSFLIYTLSLTVIIILLLQFESVKTVFKEQLEFISKQWDSSMETLKAKNVPSKELIKLGEAKTLVINIFTNYYPVLIFYFFSISLFINFVFGILLISKYVIKKPAFFNLFYIKTPEHYIWLFLTSCLFVILSFYFRKPLFKIISINIALIGAFIYIMEGSLIFVYKILKLRFHFFLKIVLLFILFQISFSYLQYAALFFGALGILDYWFDFRKINQLTNKRIDTLV